jgi:hypothetical protein
LRQHSRMAKCRSAAHIELYADANHAIDSRPSEWRGQARRYRGD